MEKNAKLRETPCLPPSASINGGFSVRKVCLADAVVSNLGHRLYYFKRDKIGMYYSPICAICMNLLSSGKSGDEIE